MHEAGKQQGCISLLKQYSNVALIAWFPETQRHWQSFFEQHSIAATVLLARQVNLLQLVNKIIILLEHYPIFTKEHDFLQSLKVPEVIILSSMDEPLFTRFGGERIIDLMQKLGVDENEAIEHKLITQSLKQAQKKLEDKVITEHNANSMKEWFILNMP